MSLDGDPAWGEILWSGKWTVLRPTGTLEADTAGPVRQALRSFTDTEVSHILVDLSEIAWMDAVGAGVLIGAYRRTGAYQGDFRLVVPSWAIRNLLKVTGLIEFVPVYHSIEAAEADLGR